MGEFIEIIEIWVFTDHVFLAKKAHSLEQTPT